MAPSSLFGLDLQLQLGRIGILVVVVVDPNTKLLSIVQVWRPMNPKNCEVLVCHVPITEQDEDKELYKFPLTD